MPSVSATGQATTKVYRSVWGVAATTSLKVDVDAQSPGRDLASVVPVDDRGDQSDTGMRGCGCKASEESEIDILVTAAVPSEPRTPDQPASATGSLLIELPEAEPLRHKARNAACLPPRPPRVHDRVAVVLPAAGEDASRWRPGDSSPAGGARSPRRCSSSIELTIEEDAADDEGGEAEGDANSCPPSSPPAAAAVATAAASQLAALVASGRLEIPAPHLRALSDVSSIPDPGRDYVQCSWSDEEEEEEECGEEPAEDPRSPRRSLLVAAKKQEPAGSAGPGGGSGEEAAASPSSSSSDSEASFELPAPSSLRRSAIRVNEPLPSSPTPLSPVSPPPPAPGPDAAAPEGGESSPPATPLQGREAPPTVRQREERFSPREVRGQLELLRELDAAEHRCASLEQELRRVRAEREAARGEARELARVAKAHEGRLLQLHERLEIAGDLNEELRRQVEELRDRRPPAP
eukprot:tig00000655_g2851.t1